MDGGHSKSYASIQSPDVMEEVYVFA
jgi:hypothetical protein